MSKLKLISFIPYRQATGKISLCPMCSELLYEMLQQVILPIECLSCRLMLGKKARRMRRVQNYGNIGYVQGRREVGSDGETEATVKMLQGHSQTQGCMKL